MLLRALSLALITALPAWAQDLQGNDTPGNWKVRHFERFGVWTSSCDERPENGSLKQRCYIRYVEVFSPHPEFGAQFVFVTPEAAGERVEFGIEPGTLFAPNGFRIERGGATSWRTRRPGCLTGVSCDFDGAEAAELLAAMANGDAMRFVFVDRHAKARDLSWPLAGFAEALADYRAQARARGLLAQ